jgi:hypothetical protein
MRESLIQREALLEEKEKIIDTMGCVLKEKDTDNIRLVAKLRLIEAQL